MRDGEIVIVQDFSNLIDCTPQDEVKAAHYGGAAQITAHPSLVYAKVEGKEIKMVITHVSDIKKHDAHMVDHITTDILDIVQKKYPDIKFRKVYLWSDGCVQQYKCKTSFHYLKKYLEKYPDIEIERNFFGTEHGKNESDGVTGEISRKVKGAIRSRRYTFNDAEELLNFLSEAMPNYQFRLITQQHMEPIYTAFECVDLTVLTGNCTRALHQIMPGEGEDEFLIRPFSCFCKYCKDNQFSLCENREYTGGDFISEKLEFKKSDVTKKAKVTRKTKATKKSKITKKAKVTKLANVTELEEEEEEESEAEEGNIEFDDSESDIEDIEEPIIISQQEIHLDDLKEGQFIIGQKYDIEKKSSENCVAKIKVKDVDRIKVNFLEQCNRDFNNNIFKLKKSDEEKDYILELKDIIMILPVAPPLLYFNERLRYTTFYFENPIIL